jgi:hypothetical protein
VCAVKAPGFGENRKNGLQDIAVLTGGEVGWTGWMDGWWWMVVDGWLDGGWWLACGGWRLDGWLDGGWWLACGGWRLDGW